MAAKKREAPHAHRPSIAQLRKLLALALHPDRNRQQDQAACDRILAALPSLLNDVEACDAALRDSKFPSLSVMMLYAQAGLNNKPMRVVAERDAVVAALPRCDASRDTFRKPIECDRIATKLVDGQLYYCDAHAKRVMSDGTGKCETLSYAKVVRKMEKRK